MEGEPSGRRGSLVTSGKLVLVSRQYQRESLRDRTTDGRIVLGWVFKRCGLREWDMFSWVRVGPSEGAFMKEVMSFLLHKGGKFVDKVSDPKLAKNDTTFL
jgi:hypothetical protein